MSSPRAGITPAAPEAPAVRAGGRAVDTVVARAGRIPPLLVAAPAWVAGDLLAARLPPPATTAGALLAGTLLVVLPHPAGRRAALGVLCLLAAWVAADRVYRPRWPPGHIARAVPVRHTLLEGRLAADPEVRGTGGGGRLWLDAERLGSPPDPQPVHGRVLVTVRTLRRAWHAGERVRLRVSLRHPRTFGTPGEFDYPAHLARRGVYVTGWLDDDARIETIGRTGAPVPDAFRRWRREVGDLFARTLPPTPAAILAAVTIGTGSAVPADLRERFARAGVAHVLAISGLHVGLVAAAGHAAAHWLLGRSRRLLLTGLVPRLAVAGALASVLAYAGIAGHGMATRRAVLMVIVMMGATVADRQRHLPVSLAAAALVVLAVSPGATMDISFQLSFVAVAGIVAGMARFEPWWQAREAATLAHLRGWRARAGRMVATYLAVTASALAATAPLTALHFNQVTPLGLVANAVVVPLLGAATVVLGLLAAVALLVCEPLAVAVTLAAWPGIAAGVAFVDLVAALPGAAWHVVTPSPLELALLYGGLGAALGLRGHWRRTVLAGVALLLAADATWWYGRRYLHEDLRVTFLSVGQADAAVVEIPGGEVLVVDAGGLGTGFDTGERLVAPFLRARKIGRVDYLVLSHAQWDHHGGLGYLAAHFGPRELWWNGVPSPGSRFAALRETLARAGVAERVLARGDTRQLGPVRATALWPERRVAAAAGLNDSSLVLSLSFAGRRVLFAGDIEHPAERALVDLDPASLSTTVLKVPHHGSRTSSTGAFVATAAPAVAVVSAGAGNPFGFPHREVMRRYLGQRAVLLRTDEDGSVFVRIDPAGRLGVAVHRHAIEWTFPGGSRPGRATDAMTEGAALLPRAGTDVDSPGRQG